MAPLLGIAMLHRHHNPAGIRANDPPSPANTQAGYAATSKAVADCVSGAQRLVMQNVNHNGPVRDPDAFSAAVLSFLEKPRGM